MDMYTDGDEEMPSTETSPMSPKRDNVGRIDRRNLHNVGRSTLVGPNNNTPQLVAKVQARPPPARGVLDCSIQAAATAMVAIVLLYMLVSMSITLLDKWILTDFSFSAPLSLIATTYFLMHVYSTLIRWRLRCKGLESDGHPLLQKLSRLQWLWKVVPVAAASGLEVVWMSFVCRVRDGPSFPPLREFFKVGTSSVGLQGLKVGFHTMIRATVPIFVLIFSVALGLQTVRLGLCVVVIMVSAGVALLAAGEHNELSTFPRVSFGLTLLSCVLSGLKWTLSQVLLQGRELKGIEGFAVAGAEEINPLTLLHYMSLSSSATLVPFVCGLELGSLRTMARDFSLAWLMQAGGLFMACSLLALLLVLLEFSFIKRVSSLSLCIVSVVKELILVTFSVVFMGEKLGGMTVVGFTITMLGVTLYKLVPKGPRPVGVADIDEELRIARANSERPNQRFIRDGATSSSDNPELAVNGNGNSSTKSCAGPKKGFFTLSNARGIDASQGESTEDVNPHKNGVQSNRDNDSASRATGGRGRGNGKRVGYVALGVGPS